MTRKLEGKIALVTGASEGIGFSIAQHFAEQGARVFLTGRRQAQLDAAVERIGHGVVGIRGDVGNLDDLDHLYREIQVQAGRIDIVVANAAVYEFGKFGDISETHFDKIFDINVRGTLFSVQKALPLLVDGGSVILVGSIASNKGYDQFSVYNASKSAIRSFARGWTNDLRDRKIRVNSLAPGHTQTPGLDVLITPEHKAQMIAVAPLDRLATGDDLAKAALFLASDDSAFITGVELYVDGGAAQV